jgi:pyruvate dehydrogenase E2 component (dihydrolipoamide acetyltransferase)
VNVADVQDILIPDFGDADGVTVAELNASPGDTIAVDDPIATLETDKAAMEVPAPVAGTLLEILVDLGDEVTVGQLIARIEVAEAEASAPASTPAPPAPVAAPVAPPPAPVAAPVAPPPAAPVASTAPVTAAPLAPPGFPAAIDEDDRLTPHASPAVRRFARELGVDLAGVAGTGRKGRVTKDDVHAHVKRAMAQPPGGGLALPPPPRIDFSKFGPITVEPLGKIQKASARNLHRSWLHIPHVTQHEDADITEMNAFRKAQKADAASRGFKLTPLSFILKATAGALREFPRFRSSLDPEGHNLILKGYIHIGVAVDTPRGLVVPVVRDVDKKGVYAIARELGEISARARAGKLRLDEMSGSVFSISSLGGIGGTSFTPVVNLPEVAILGVARAELKPVWSGSAFEPRLILPLSLSYDHRVIDGAAAARFVVHLRGLLTDLRRLIL